MSELKKRSIRGAPLATEDRSSVDAVKNTVSQEKPELNLEDFKKHLVRFSEVAREITSFNPLMGTIPNTRVIKKWRLVISEHYAKVTALVNALEADKLTNGD